MDHQLVAKVNRLRRVDLTLLLAAFCVCLAGGCDDVSKAVNDMKSEVSGTAPSAAPASGTPVTESPAPAPVEVPKGPTPEETVARFQKLSPGDITDGDLTQLASAGEAAAVITKIDLSGNTHVTRAGLSQLAALKNLSAMNMTGCQMLPPDLSAVADIPSLKELELVATRTDDTVVARLVAIPHLTKLDLARTPITSASGSSLSQLKELTSLSLMETAADDRAVSAVTGLPLQLLNLRMTRITGAIIPEVMRIETLENLNVANTGVPGIAWKGAGRADLKVLVVGETPFGLEGFNAIKGMKSLEELNVYNAGLVEHKAANIFKSLPKLRILNAGNNAVTDAGMEVFFKGLDKIEELHLGTNRGISDNGLSFLVGLKTLKFLDVTGTGCSAAGATALKQRLPDCRILTSNGEF